MDGHLTGHMGGAAGPGPRLAARQAKRTNQEGTLQESGTRPFGPCPRHGPGQPVTVRCAPQLAKTARVADWIWTTMLTEHAPAAACAGAGLSPAPAERAAAGRWNDPGVDDDRPAEHVLHDA